MYTCKSEVKFTVDPMTFRNKNKREKGKCTVATLRHIQGNQSYAVVCTHARLPTCVDDEDVSKVLFSCGVVASKVDNTVTYAGSTVAPTTFDPIPRHILLFPCGGTTGGLF